MRPWLPRLLLLVVVAFAACAPAATTSAPAPPVPNERDSEQILRAAISGLPASLTPQASASAFYAFYPFYDNLTQYGPNFEVRPAIATKWELGADGKSWRFTIRNDVKWPDGSALTADDVAFTFQQMVDRAWPQRSFFGTVTGARAIDPATVEVATRTTDVSVSSGGPYLWIVPKKYIESVGLDGFTAKPMGSGPYEVADYKAGDSIRFKKKAEHAYRKAVATEIFLRAVPDASQLINGLRTGELDIVPFSNFTATQADALKQAGVQLQVFPISNSSFSMPQGVAELRQSPLRDKRVRLAINYAVDKDAIAKTIYKGLAEPVGQYAIPPSLLWDPDLKPIPYNPAMAKQLLADAGYPTGFKLPYGIDYSPMILSELVLAIQGYLKDVGIEAELHNNENAALQDKIFGRNNQIIGDIYAGGTGDQNGYAATVRTTNGCGKPVGSPPASVWYCNPEWDTLFDSLYTEKDAAKRAQTGRQITRIFRDDVPVIFGILQPLYVAHSSKLREVNVRYLGVWNMDSIYKVK